LLLKCWGGCSIGEITGALGLELHHLFPEQPDAGRPHRERRPFHADDLLRVLAFEAQLVALAAAELLAGKTPSKLDRDRLQLAADRLNEALHVNH
jgi:hypothetical protein